MSSDNREKWTAGFTLPQSYFNCPQRFDREFVAIRNGSWFLVGHESRIPGVGDYFLYDIGPENILIVRGRDGLARAFYNVCRHRGSRVCLERAGNARQLTCPYHAWTYELDGRLRAAPYMPRDFQREGNGLTQCQLRAHQGLIFVTLGDAPPPIESLLAPLQPFLQHYDIAGAKIAAHRSYPTRANWKLVMQNWRECYHCAPAHPSYSFVHSAESRLTMGGEADLHAPYLESAAGFISAEADRGFDPPRQLIGNGMLTESIDGKPVAPLMGHATFDGAQAAFFVDTFSTVLMSPDHAVLFTFIPRSVADTDVHAIWLVRGNAVEGVDYDVTRLLTFWENTLSEDTTLVENNQLGVNSHSYRPGRYSRLEADVMAFDEWYVRSIAP